MGLLDDQRFRATDEPRQPRVSWNVWAWLGVAVGIVLRFRELGRQSIWMDEGYTAWVVRHPWGEIIRLIRVDTAPPLYYLLLRSWTNVFGHTEWGLRSFSAVLGVLTMLVAMDIARRLLTRGAAVAVWAVAVGYSQVYFAQEARFYALMALLMVGALDLLLRFLSTRDRRWLVPLVLVLAAALYTHNLMVPYVGAFFLCWLIVSPQSWREMVGTGAAVGMIYLPWAIFMLPGQLRMVHQAFWVGRPGYAAIMSLVASLFNMQSVGAWNQILGRYHVATRMNFAPLWAGIFLAGISLAMSIALQREARRRQAAGLLVLVLLPPLVVTIYSLVGTPILMERTFLTSGVLMPILLLLPFNLPWSASGLRYALFFGAILLVLMLGSLLVYEALDRKEDWRGAAEMVSELPPAHRLIVFDAEDGQLPFEFYYRFDPGEDVTGVPGGFFDLDPPRALRRVLGRADLDSLAGKLKAGNYDQVVLVAAHLFWADPQGLTVPLIEREYPEVKVAKLKDVSVFVFEKNNDSDHGPRWAWAWADSYQVTSTAVASSARFWVPAN
jgi:4-amino-4-deoxy-L-arabinose transferase-like glycosyltransferase